MATRTFTIYNCGTAYDRSNSQELVASLAARTLGKEAVDWIINAGPGSEGLLARSTRTKLVQAVVVAGGSVLASVPPDIPKTGIDYLSRLAGDATGTGMDYNVEDSVQIVLRTRPNRINMVGWSRGAIASLRIANALSRRADFPPVPINLFLIDPVPGRGNVWNWDHLSTTVPSCVHHCSVILQEGEGRFIMEPLVQPFIGTPGIRGTTRFKMYPMPGPHSAAVETSGLFEPVAQLARYLVETFLRDHGTLLRDRPFHMGARAVCECYAKMIMALWAGQGRTLRRTKLIPNSERTSRLFVNQHHHRKFRFAYPMIANELKNLRRRHMCGRETQLKVQHEALVMKKLAPVTFTSISTFLTYSVMTGSLPYPERVYLWDLFKP